MRRKGRDGWWWLLSGVLLLGVPDQAFARDGWDLHTFRPAAGALGVFHTQPSRTLPGWSTNFGLTSDLAFNPLTARRDGDVEKYIVNRTWDLHLQGRLGLPEQLELDLTMPLRVYSNGYYPGTEEELASFAPGDLELALRWQAAQLLGGGLGLQLNVGLPTGKPEELSGDPGVKVGGQAILDGRVSLFHWAANLGFRYRPEVTVLDAEVGPELYYALGGDFLLPFQGILATRGIYLGAELFGATAASGNFFAGQQSPFESVLGGTLVWKVCRLGIGVGQGWQPGLGTPDFRFLTRLTCGAQDEDRDGDGWLDPLDPCPDVAEDHTGAEDGCADPDQDGDGLPDRLDRCPKDPEDRDRFEDEDGCPDPDNDKDGVCDPWVAERKADKQYAGLCKGSDKCPLEPEDRDRFEDADGCPDPDNDRDGVLDPWVTEQKLTEKYKAVGKGADKCPDEPEDVDQFQDEDGCPDPDNDGDGVADGSDKCPNEPETYNGFQDDDGCPDGLELAKVETAKIEIKQVVYFKTASAEVEQRSHKLLQTVAGIMKKYKDIKKVRVEGHTDDRNTDEYNLKLSKDRARSVMEFLIAQGVEKERLESEGYGEGKPVIDVVPLLEEQKKAKGKRKAQLKKEIDEARAKNRRVEYVILARSSVEDVEQLKKKEVKELEEEAPAPILDGAK